MLSTYRPQAKSRLAIINDLPDFELVPRHVFLLIYSVRR